MYICSRDYVKYPKTTLIILMMYHQDGHIIFVNGQQIVGRMFGGLDIIYKDRQTDRH
jgi:hypothetical protein